MRQEKEASFPTDYRAARQAFIKACERAHVDSIARVHPARSAPDGKPLFMDCAAQGPREAVKGLLVIGGGDGGSSHALNALLDVPVALPAQTRLVLVHGLMELSDDTWPLAMLGDILTEDMARVEKLRVLQLTLGRTDQAEILPSGALADAIRARKPAAALKMVRLILGPADAMERIRGAARAALASL